MYSIKPQMQILQIIHIFSKSMNRCTCSEAVVTDIFIFIFFFFELQP